MFSNWVLNRCQKILSLFFHYSDETHLEIGGYIYKQAELQNIEWGKAQRNTGETTIFSKSDYVVWVLVGWR